MCRRKTTSSRRSRRRSSFWRACTHTSASVVARSVFLRPARNSRRRRSSALSNGRNRSGVGDRLTSLSSRFSVLSWAIWRSGVCGLAENCELTTENCFMKRIRYSKYVPDPAGEMSMEDLLSALSDYLLQSGFQNYMFYDLPEGEKTLDALRQAIEQALLDGDRFDEEMRERLQQMQMDGTLDELIEKLIERMEQEDFISIEDPPDPSKTSTTGGQVGESQQQAKFEITDKSLDFLCYKALRDLLGSLGKSSFGRHDTRDMATGVEASGASKVYEFG